MPVHDQSHTARNISNAIPTTTTDAEPVPKMENSNGGGQENGRGNNRSKRKGTATASMEATTGTVVIQAIKTATPAEENSSDYGGGISSPENPSTPKT